MYIMPDVKIDNKIYDNVCTATSVAVSYLHGFALNQKKPIFLETGFGIKWGMYDVDIDEDSPVPSLWDTDSNTLLFIYKPGHVAQTTYPGL